MKMTMQFKRRTAVQRSYEIKLSEEAKKHLSFFIKQELAYYNALVEGLTPWLRSFPTEFHAFKNNERRIWSFVAERGIDPHILAKMPRENWPVEGESLYSIMINENKACRFTQRQLDIMKVVSSPAKIPLLTRNIMANDILRNMLQHATVLETAHKNDSMKAPIQLLQPQTLNTKRHLQVPFSVIHSRMYDAEKNASVIMTPFTRHQIVVPGVNIMEQKFKMMVIKSPHRLDAANKWYIDLKDSENYDSLLTDFDVKKRKR